MLYDLRAWRQIRLRALSLLFYLPNPFINLFFVLQFIAFWCLDTRCDMNSLIFITVFDTIDAFCHLFYKWFAKVTQAAVC